MTELSLLLIGFASGMLGGLVTTIFIDWLRNQARARERFAEMEKRHQRFVSRVDKALGHDEEKP